MLKPEPNLPASVFSEASEPQTTLLSGVIAPHAFRDGFDAIADIEPKPDIDRPVWMNRGVGLKTKASLGDVQHRSSVFPIQLDKREFVRRFS